MRTNVRHLAARALLAGIISGLAFVAQAAELRVLADSPLGPALAKVAELFGQETHNQVRLAFDPSPEVKRRIEAGEAADVVIVQPDFIEELIRAGRVNAGERPVVGRVGVGLGNRTNSPVHDISTPEKLRQTLLGADLIVFNKVVSGNTFARALERLGIAQTLSSRIVRTAPNGIFEPVLQGRGNDFVAGTMPLIATTSGMRLLGPLPGDLQNYLTYTAALMTNASEREAAESFVRFLGSPRAKELFAANGVD
ncbi:molybdate ABC transporter substrate-binding protein [Azospirillum canadense]|uniref:molybdate ABC transporter substrate-binding protein n=1 Tax=Azospirillum canadense TaxID=403962 RepID=UPI002227F8CB|nr:substrate-binding domain-containing protein [Azospirillum canadense]MCW2239070.1 molybdate transport system substrate-binding protein [Azospirillum canadense]